MISRDIPIGGGMVVITYFQYSVPISRDMIGARYVIMEVRYIDHTPPPFRDVARHHKNKQSESKSLEFSNFTIKILRTGF